MTHCVQYDRIGATGVMLRRGVETVTHGPNGQYDITAALTERSIYVNARNDANNDVVVEWRVCGSRALAPERTVTVYLKGVSEEQDFECSVLPASDKLNGKPLDRAWQYGSAPPGYVLEGNCPPLQVGRDYGVSVGTFGSERFSILRDGGVEVTDRWCKWWRDL